MPPHIRFMDARRVTISLFHKLRIYASHRWYCKLWLTLSSVIFCRWTRGDKMQKLKRLPTRKNKPITQHLNLSQIDQFSIHCRASNVFWLPLKSSYKDSINYCELFSPKAKKFRHCARFSKRHGISELENRLLYLPTPSGWVGATGLSQFSSYVGST